MVPNRIKTLFFGFAAVLLACSVFWFWFFVPRFGVSKDFASIPKYGHWLSGLKSISRVSFYSSRDNMFSASAMGSLEDYEDFAENNGFSQMAYKNGAPLDSYDLEVNYAPTGGHVYIAKRMVPGGRRCLIVFYEPSTIDEKVGMIYVQFL